MNDKPKLPESGFYKNSVVPCSAIINPRLPMIFSSLAITALLITGCSQQSEQEFSSSEESADYASEDIGVVESEQSDAASSPIKLKVENQAGDSEQTLGSQVADIQIQGKELLITANATFKVEDVVKSTTAIETLTRQQGGYVALSKTTNVETDSRTFNKGDQNVTLTTYYRQAEMTVRIPREKVSAFL